jgi:hypothetical protein
LRSARSSPGRSQSLLLLDGRIFRIGSGLGWSLWSVMREKRSR